MYNSQKDVCRRLRDYIAVTDSCQSWCHTPCLYHQLTDQNQTDQKNEHVNKHQCDGEMTETALWTHSAFLPSQWQLKVCGVCWALQPQGGVRVFVNFSSWFQRTWRWTRWRRTPSWSCLRTGSRSREERSCSSTETVNNASTSGPASSPKKDSAMADTTGRSDSRHTGDIDPGSSVKY